MYAVEISIKKWLQNWVLALQRYSATFLFSAKGKNLDGGAGNFWQIMVDLDEKWQRVVRVAINVQFLSGGL